MRIPRPAALALGLAGALILLSRPLRAAPADGTTPPTIETPPTWRGWGAACRSSFDIADKCGIPATAQAVSFNFTVVGPTGGGDLRIFPGDAALPTVSTINYRAGQVRANNAILLLGPSGNISVRVDQGGGIVHLIIDVNGYFE